MSDQQTKDASCRFSIYRVMALVVALGGHLLLVMVLLRPPSRWANAPLKPASAVTRDGPAEGLRVLELQLAEPSLASRPMQRLVVPAFHRVPAPSVPMAIVRRVQPAPPPREPAVRPPGRTRSTGVPRGLDLRAPPGAGAGDDRADDDRSFGARLRHAEQTGRVRHLPGTDQHVAPGIHLTDPSDQGLGAMMRKAQRLFGITSHACIDVDVWSTLSRRELAAKHITLGQVKRLAERYHCNEPPGLHF